VFMILQNRERRILLIGKTASQGADSNQQSG